MIEADAVRQLRELHALGWGIKRIARELGIHRDTVRRYVRQGPSAEIQQRPNARCLDAAGVARAHALLAGEAEGNAVVVRAMLRAEGYDASERTVQRVLQPSRREARAAQLATVRVETEPGRQMQIDFGQKLVRIADEVVRVFVLVAVLGFSRRIFVKAFLAERHDDWREGVAEAFRRFGGVPREVLGDNASALVVAHDRATRTVTFHPAWLAFCGDWGVTPKACAPFRARTKGKCEAGVKYVKRNALAGRSFASFAALEAHLAAWMDASDLRDHGTTHETPLARFDRAERAALQPLPLRPAPARQRRLRRRVSNDAYVLIDTVRYSVPHRLVATHVEVLVGDDAVEIFAGATRVAVHRRTREPHEKVTDPSHHLGLYRSPVDATAPSSQAPAPLARSLEAYAAIVAAGGAA